MASRHPYYKYNVIWTMGIQNSVLSSARVPSDDAFANASQCFAVLLCGWLGGVALAGSPAQQGRLLTLEEVGQVLRVPVNLKDRDAFHLSIEEYLHALISVIEELVRAAPLGDALVLADPGDSPGSPSTR